MRPTRRALGVITTAGVLFALAAIVNSPILGFGGIALSAWLLARAYTFVSTVTPYVETLTVSVDTATRQRLVDERVLITVTAQQSHEDALTASINATAPVGATLVESIPEFVISHLDQSNVVEFACKFPTAGQYTFPRPNATITDTNQLFAVTVPVGETLDIQIEPRTPRDLQIGQAGDTITAAYGEHSAGKTGDGISPAELREYVTGDAAEKIDWKATARLNTPHVREYEAETDRQTMVVVDCRGTTAIGPDGMTLLSYSREVALGIANVTESAGDPLGCWTIGDEGITNQIQANARPAHYARVKEILRGLEPTTPTTESLPSNAVVRPGAVRQRKRQLTDDPHPFARTLRPFFENQAQYVERLTEDPLFETIRRIQATSRGSTWTILITDDAHRTQTQEAVRLAADQGNQVLAFISPRVLYDESTDLESAYDQYRSFEKFRQGLAQLPRVSAFEFGPGEQLNALLQANTNNRREQSAGEL